MKSAADRLRAIQTFDDLVIYLEDELGWPLQEYGFNELTFVYEPEELGLREEEIAKINKIHQLRLIRDNQPWGIFFIDFEQKRLPVVALRRILNRLVIKKRSSANSAHRARWEMSDLLFISSFGQGDDRHISLAHFKEDKEMGDLPTLMVLGWDGDRGLSHDRLLIGCDPDGDADGRDELLEVLGWLPLIHVVLGDLQSGRVVDVVARSDNELGDVGVSAGQLQLVFVAH